MKTNLYVLALVVSLITSSCGKLPDDLNMSSPEFEGIMGGTETSVVHQSSRYVVLIYDPSNDNYCTGMLIHPRVILTAAHCVKSSAENYNLAFGNRPLEGYYVMRSAQRTLIHDKYNKDSNQNRNDLAMILIKGQAPKGYKALYIPGTDFPLETGLFFTASGFGRTTGKYDPTGKDVQGSGVLRHIGLQIDSITEDQTQFYVNQKNGKGICNGDSGGPAIMRYNKRDYVVGVASAIAWMIPGELNEKAKKEYLEKSNVCAFKSIYINVKTFQPWIQEGLKELLK